ncbi:DUF86 domain-containing protein [Microseira sp. BLCC-F43]|jgi:uncharacterized protein with HEPN domain|uniref:HepT-like ribonuclease domain-containing protein n=1 Tax=Microseira sp. BLCC-F43 TaxID=3153602 RepID=UPI0035B87700
MSTRDLDYLLDILISAKLALSYVSGKTFTEFEADIQCQDSVTRRLEIIGEAAKRLSQATRLSLSQIPWSDMIGMRNRMIHQYDKVNLAIVWNTLQNALPPLIEELETVVPPEDRA